MSNQFLPTPDSIPDRVRHRKFLVLDRHKQSQPQKLDHVAPDFSPRSQDSLDLSVHQQVTPSWPSHPVAIQVEDEDGIEISSIHSYDEKDQKASGSFSTKIIDDDVKSQISFIMKERLHTLAREVARRTSTVRESLLRESPDDTISTVSVGPQTEEQRPSLMSLIGLQKGSDMEAEGTEGKTCWWFPESIHPYGRLYMSWLFLVTLAFLYNAFCIPLRSSYPYQTKSNLIYWLIVDYTCDGIYLIDMALIKPRLRFMKGGISVVGFIHISDRF